MSTMGSLSTRRSKRTTILIVVGVALIVVLAGLAAFFFWQYKKASTDESKISEHVLSRVSSLYLVPDEKPTVAEIKDKESLSDQPFFDKAENGDYLLVYEDAAMALLYRESIHKIVNSGPVSMDGAANQPADNAPSLSEKTEQE